jgi:hypothetical protein
MKTKTLKALKESIKHWDRMATGKARLGEEPDSDHCALCSLFNRDNMDEDKNVCRGCPIYESTGRCWCAGTGYSSAWVAWDVYGIKSQEFRSKAAEFLKYLKSLLPKKKLAKKK